MKTRGQQAFSGLTLSGPHWAGIGLSEGGQAQSVGVACPQYFEVWAGLKMRMQHMFSGLTLAGSHWAGFGLSEGGQAQAVDAGSARTRADLQCVEDGLSMPSVFF